MTTGGPIPISAEHLPTCKMGQGEACCRYLVFDMGFSCAKHTPLAPLLDTRVEAGSMRARGDNCDGFPAPEETP